MRNVSAVSCLCLVLFLSVAGCTREQERPKVAQQAGGDIATQTAVLATIASDEKPPQDPPHGEEPAAQSQPATFQVIFSESGRGVSYLVDKAGKVSVVHNQKKGKEYAAVGAIVLSPDGQRIAYLVQADSKWRMVVDGKEGRPFDGVLTPIFSPDGQHVVYQAKEGNKWFIVVDERVNAGTVASYTTPDFSSDSKSIAYVEGAESSSGMRLIISDLTFSKQIVKQSIGDLLFTTNRNKTKLAAAQAVDNRLRVIDFSFAKPDIVHEGPLYEVIEKLAVGDDGDVVYCALKAGKRLLVLNDKEEPLPKGLLPEFPVIRPDGKGVGLLLGSEHKISLHQSFYDVSDQGKKYDEAASLTYSKDSRYFAYAARNGESWFVVVNGKEGPAFDKVVTPHFSPDGKLIVYRARKGGKRFVVIADTDCKTIRQHPAYEQVFDVHFTPDGKSVAYGVKDGNQLIWKVEKL